MPTWLRNILIVIFVLSAVFVAMGVVVFIQGVYADWVFNRFPNDISKRGQFGDMFGAVNAFFTGLAFTGVVVAIYLQTRELALQRKELVLTRRELARAAKAQTKQAKMSAEATELTFNLGVMIRLQEVLYKIADHEQSFAYVWEAESSRPKENSREQLSAHAMLDVLSMAIAAARRLPEFSRNAAEDWKDYIEYALTNSPALLNEVLANPTWWPELKPFAEEVERKKRSPIVSSGTREGAGDREAAENGKLQEE
jgi:hypothetical protein